MTNLVAVLYIIAFGMFIYGLMGLTGPKTAVRGNWIAAAGMAIAVVATLVAIRHTTNWGWIVAAFYRALCSGSARPDDEDDRDAATRGAVQRCRRWNRGIDRVVGVHRHRRFFGLQAW